VSVYMIVDIEVHDPVAYEQYKAGVPPLVRKHGGEYLVRGGPLRVFEGDWNPARLVLLRFPTMEAAEGFLNDPQYQPLKALRQQSTKSNMVVVEGV
jgi:uncharacterized protein (DUF1330 family)